MLPGAAKSCHRLPRLAKSIQKLPRGTRSSYQELPGITKSCQWPYELPEHTSSCPELPVAARSSRCSQAGSRATKSRHELP